MIMPAGIILTKFVSVGYLFDLGLIVKWAQLLVSDARNNDYNNHLISLGAQKMDIDHLHVHFMVRI